MLVTPSANEMSLQPRCLCSYRRWLSIDQEADHRKLARQQGAARARSEKRRPLLTNRGWGNGQKTGKKKGAGRNKDQGEIFIEALRNIARRKNTVQGIGRRRPPPRQDKIFRAWRFSGNISRERERERVHGPCCSRARPGLQQRRPGQPDPPKKMGTCTHAPSLVSKEWPSAAEHRPSEPNRQTLSDRSRRGGG